MRLPKGLPLLCVPPQVDPSQPLYALPALAAWARKCGVPVTLDDLNVRAYHRLLSPDWLSRSLARLDATEDRVRRLYPGRLQGFLRERRRSEYCASFVLGSVEWAKSALRNPDEFYNFDAYTRAMRIVHRALELISCAHFPTALGFQSFEMNASVRFLKDVCHAAADSEENPFLEYFREDVLPEVEAAAPPLIGFSLMSPTQFIPAVTLARLVKQVMPKTFIVVGGAPILYAADRVAQFGKLAPYVDAFVVGDGEEALVELIRALEQGDELRRVPNLIMFQEGQAVAGPLRDVPMDALPTPDFDGLPLDLYFSPEPNLPLLASKGCYWGKCAFCTNSDPHSRHRARPMEQLVEDAVRLREKYSTDVFSLIDDCLSPQQAGAFAEKLLSRDVHIRWRFRTRAERAYTVELCRRLFEAGCRKVYIGIESGAQRILDRMNKGTRLGTVESVLRNFNTAGLPVHAFCIVGFPGETLEDVKQTTDLLARHRDVIESMLVAPYVLRRRSAAGRSPARHGLVDVREEGDGLVDEIDFAVEHGISPAEAGRIAREALSEVASRASLEDGHDSRYDARHAHRYYLGNRYFSALDAPNFMYHCRYGRRSKQPSSVLRRERARRLIESVEFADACPVLCANVEFRRAGPEAYLLNTETGHILELSPDAADLIKLCDGTGFVRNIVASFLTGRSPTQTSDISCYNLLKELVLAGDLELRFTKPAETEMVKATGAIL